MTQDSNPNNQDNFRLVCKHCGWKPIQSQTMKDVLDHYNEFHPELVKEDGKPDISLELIWIGKGPAPKPQK